MGEMIGPPPVLMNAEFVTEATGGRWLAADHARRMKMGDLSNDAAGRQAINQRGGLVGGTTADESKCREAEYREQRQREMRMDCLRLAMGLHVGGSEVQVVRSASKMFAFAYQGDVP